MAGVGIAIAGMATGIGMVAFAEAQVRLRFGLEGLGGWDDWQSQLFAFVMGRILLRSNYDVCRSKYYVLFPSLTRSKLFSLLSLYILQGERAKERGGGLSDSMSTQLSGMLMEDVEVSTVSDISSLTSQLEEALKATGGTSEDELELSEEEKKRLEEEADDGW